jgi:hypothetical protein
MEQLGQAFLSTDQPDHRQRIPVTLLEQSGLESRAGLPRLHESEGEISPPPASTWRFGFDQTRTMKWRIRQGPGPRTLTAFITIDSNFRKGFWTYLPPKVRLSLDSHSHDVSVMPKEKN